MAADGDGARCRACLGSSLGGSVRLRRGGWLLNYQLCVPTEIPEQQLAGAVLCAECSVLVKQFAQFKRTCEQSETYWQLLWKKTLECETLPLECPVPVAVDDKPIKVETEDIDVIDVKDETNNSDISFEVTCYREPLNDVKVEEKQLSVKPKSVEKTSLKECLHTIKTHGEPGTKRKTVKQCTERQGKKTRYKKGPFICDACGKNYSAKSNLAVHIRRIHEQTILCGLCQYQTNDAAEVNRHLLQHFANNDLKCGLCDFEGRDFADMVGHRSPARRLRHRAAGARPACPRCGRRSGCPLAAEFHFRAAHLRERGGRCHTCGKQFATLKKWKSHEYFHDNGFQCHVPHCRKWFRARAALAAHLAAHPAPPPAAVCHHCGRLFSRNSNLTLHVRLVHGARRALPCPHCTRVFAQPQYLARHLRLAAGGGGGGGGGGGPRHACPAPHCARAFPSREQLAGHAATHRSERPHACDACGRRYKRKQALTAHLKKHFGARAAQCPECPAAFFTAGELRRHRAAHSGRRRHACALCPRSFHEARLLRQHRLAAHPPPPPPPPPPPGGGSPAAAPDDCAVNVCQSAVPP